MSVSGGTVFSGSAGSSHNMVIPADAVAKDLEEVRGRKLVTIQQLGNKLNRKRSRLFPAYQFAARD